jgi:hypothetical protein
MMKGAEILLCEIKAAAIDVATREALSRGLDVVYMDNVPVALEGEDAGRAVERMGQLAHERFAGPAESRLERGTGSAGPQNEPGTGSAGPQNEPGAGSAGPQNEPGTGSAGPQNEPGTGSAGPQNQPGRDSKQ